jgi:hypothetical protein
MKKSGVISKMIAKCKPKSDSNTCCVSYALPVGDEVITMNDLIGHQISLLFKNEIHCLHCGNLTKKSYGQGYCYPCFISIPETDECILRPELCQAHLGISRDMEWSKANCLKEHYVYLAISSGLKVGVTRASQVPTRWIDQGAWKAVQLAKTENRHLAGQIEVALKEHFDDKTNWRNMLTDKINRDIDLQAEKEEAKNFLPDNLTRYLVDENHIQEFHYPVLTYPVKVKSINFDKEHEYSGILEGIKGQYLIFKGGDVLNIRKHNGYLVELQTNSS